MRNRITLTIATILFVIATVAAFGHPVHAQTPGSTPPGNIAASGAASSGTGTEKQVASCFGFGGVNLKGCLIEIEANVADSILGAVATLVAIASSIMSFTIVLTLHIRDFVNATPAIFEVWTTLRDVTSLFFIFFLLFAAFKIILGFDNKVGELIKNLVLAGILINFSFFITGAMIDASNIVSQTLYNAMVPVSVTTVAAEKIKSGDISAMLTDVTGMNANSLQNVDSSKYGIADIFRNALKLNSFKGGKAPDSKVVGDPLKILFISIVGIVIMITACLSFLAAAAAFIVRLVILIFLLAVSPLWFASWIIPQLKKEFDFIGKLMPQLIFMPVYLLLMYIGLKVIAGSNMLAAANASIEGASGATNWIFSYIVLSINFAIVIVILNLPLFVALAMSGNLSKKTLEKFGADTIWKNVGTWTQKRATGFGSQLGSRTFGRAAYSFNEKITPRIMAASPLLGSITDKTIGSVAKAGFGTKKGGYEDRLKAKKKREEDMHKIIGDRLKNTGASDTDVKAYQAKYRANLPWKNGVIGAVLDNRAHVETQKKLSKKVEEQQKKDAKKEAQKKKDDLIKKKRQVDNDQSLTQAQKDERRRQIDDEIAEHDAVIAEGREIEENERNENLASKIENSNKGEEKK